MTSKFTELAIDCHDARRLAEFWCAVLGYAVQDEDEEGAVAIGSPTFPDGKATPGPIPPQLTFLGVPEGKTVKNRLHIDLNPTDRDQDDEVRRLIGLGARHADVGQRGDESWVVLADPEGSCQVWHNNLYGKQSSGVLPHLQGQGRRWPGRRAPGG